MNLHFAAAALALLAERLFGYPKAIHLQIGHPVEWIGILLSKLEVALYDSDAEPLQARLGGLAALTLAGIAGALFRSFRRRISRAAKT